MFLSTFSLSPSPFLFIFLQHWKQLKGIKKSSLLAACYTIFSPCRFFTFTLSLILLFTLFLSLFSLFLFPFLSHNFFFFSFQAATYTSSLPLPLLSCFLPFLILFSISLSIFLPQQFFFFSLSSWCSFLKPSLFPTHSSSLLATLFISLLSVSPSLNLLSTLFLNLFSVHSYSLTIYFLSSCYNVLKPSLFSTHSPSLLATLFLSLLSSSPFLRPCFRHVPPAGAPAAAVTPENARQRSGPWYAR